MSSNSLVRFNGDSISAQYELVLQVNTGQTRHDYDTIFLQLTSTPLIIQFWKEYGFAR